MQGDSIPVPSGRVLCTCATCGKQFTARCSTVADGWGIYCSRPCCRVPLETRFWRKIRKTEGCWLWTASANSKGYGKIAGDTRPDGSKATLAAHRVSYELHFGPIPEGQEVLHTCDNPPCVNPAHLFLGTQTENMQDCARKGRAASGERNGWRTMPEAMRTGERHPGAKVTDDQVRAIRVRYAEGGVSYRELGEQYGLSAPAVCNIVTRKTRKDVD